MLGCGWRLEDADMLSQLSHFNNWFKFIFFKYFIEQSTQTLLEIDHVMSVGSRYLMITNRVQCIQLSDGALLAYLSKYPIVLSAATVSDDFICILLSIYLANN